MFVWGGLNMKKVNLWLAAELKKEYKSGMLVDYGISHPLCVQGYGKPNISIYTPAQENPIKIIKIGASFDYSNRYFLHFIEHARPCLEVTFDKNERTNLKRVVLEQSKIYLSPVLEVESGRHCRLNHQLFDNIIAYIHQTNCDPAEQISQLLYFDKPSEENIKKAIKYITNKGFLTGKLFHRKKVIDLDEKDLDAVVEALFDKTVLSSHVASSVFNFEEVKNLVLKRDAA
jgi:hypothetical protein